MKEFAIR